MQFGDNDGTLLSCECRSWQRSRLLCKHFFAIFNHFPEWNWEKLPQDYRESPFITLDYHLLNGSSPTQPSSTISPFPADDNLQLGEPLPKKPKQCSEESDSPPPQAPIPIKSKQLFKRNEGKKCRHLLDEIRQLTFLVQDQKVLASLHKELANLLKDVQQYKPSEEGLVLEGGESTSSTRKTDKVSSKACSTIEKRCKAKLPKRSTKNKYTGRVGKKAAMNRKTCYVHVPVNATPQTQTANFSKVKMASSTNYKEQNTPSLTSQDRRKEKENETDKKMDAKDSLDAPNCSRDTFITKTETPPHTTQTQTMDEKEKVDTPKCSSVQDTKMMKRSSDDAAFPKLKVANSENLTEQNTPSAPQDHHRERENKTDESTDDKDKVYPPDCSRDRSIITGDTLSPTAQDEKDKVDTSHCSGMQETKMKQTTLHDGTKTVTVVGDDYPNPTIWLSICSSCTGDPTLTLYQETKRNILKKTGWLYDSEIHAGQTLLKKEFNFIDGLHDPAIRCHLVDPATSEFIQIINVGRHWVCLSTIGAPSPGVVRVFDSLYSKPNAITIEHACRMLLHTGDVVTFVNEKVQKQLGSSDCGLFALAFATDLCHGLDPTNRSYDQQMMRQHYVNCLEGGMMSPFPTTTRRVPYHLDTKKTIIPIFCECRLPNDKKEYVECSRCSGWYHPDCVQVPDWAINSKRKWQCQKCKDHRTLRLSNSLV